MRFFTHTWYLFLHYMTQTVRMPVWIVMSIVQPILWLVLFGQLFRSVATLPGFEGASYQQFLAPGIVVMSTIMSASFSGMGILNDIEQGVLDRLLATPVPRLAILTARVLQSSVTVIVQGLLILGLAALFGVRSPGGIVGVLAVLIAAALIGAAGSAFSNSLALVLRNPMVLVPALNFLLLPCIFTSSMIMSRDAMPGWIQTVGVVNPLDWGVRVARTGFEGAPWSSVTLPLILLLASVPVNWWLAAKAFDRYRATL